MAVLLRRDIIHPNGEHYALEIGFDDFALMEDKVALTVSALKFLDDSDSVEKVEATIAINYHKHVLEVSLPGLETFSIPLDHESLLDGATDEAIFNTDELQRYWSGLVNAAGEENAFENMLQHMPAGDPFLGCIIKAGVSTTIGQLITCNRDVVAEEWRQRALKLFRCLRQNGHTMLKRSCWRTVRCWMTLGFG